jgi:hypothetical protein
MANRLVGKNRLTMEEREVLREKRLKNKDKYENGNMGDYQNIYPLKRGVCAKDDALMDKYEFIYKTGKDVYLESMAGGGKVKAKKEEPAKIETWQNINKSKTLKKDKSILGLPSKPSSSSIIKSVIPPSVIEQNYHHKMATTQFSPRSINNTYYFDKNSKLQLSTNAITNVLGSNKKYSQTDNKGHVEETPNKVSVIDNSGYKII